MESIARYLPYERLVLHLRVPLYRQAYALTVSAISNAILGMAFWVLAARNYPVEIVGLNTAIISTITFLSSVAGLNLDSALLRFLPRAGRATVRLVTLSSAMALALSGVATLIFLAGAKQWAGEGAIVGTGLDFTLLFAVATIATSIYVMEDAVLTGIRQAVWLAVKNPALSLVKLALLVVFVRVMPEYGILGAWTIPGVLVVIVVGLLIYWRFLPGHAAQTEASGEPVSAGQIARYVAGSYGSYLFLMAYTSLLPLVVLNRAGSAASAYFYPAWVMMTSLQLVASNMSTSLVVEGSNDPGRLAFYLRHSFVHLLRLLLPAVIVIFVGAPYIMAVFGKAYQEQSSMLLRLFALALLPNIVWVLHMGVLRVEQRIGWLIALQAALAIGLLSASYFILPIYGITGIGVVWLTFQSVAAALLLLLRIRPLLRSPASA